jgi:hypothetical protein
LNEKPTQLAAVGSPITVWTNKFNVCVCVCLCLCKEGLCSIKKNFFFILQINEPNFVVLFARRTITKTRECFFFLFSFFSLSLSLALFSNFSKYKFYFIFFFLIKKKKIKNLKFIGKCSRTYAQRSRNKD